MTSTEGGDPKPAKSNNTLFIWNRFKSKATDYAIVAILGLSVTLVFEPVRTKLSAIWKTPAQLEEIADTQDKILKTLESLTGENRITNQPEGMSYVREPVGHREEILLILFIGRTQLGAACEAKSYTPVFMDENGITASLEPRTPRRQLSTSVERRSVSMVPPPQITAGRTSVQLQIRYLCGDKVIFEMTRPVFYYATPSE